MTLGGKIVTGCLSLALLASAGMAHAGEPVTDRKMAGARQLIRCGKTAMMLSQVTTAPGSKEYYAGLALVLGGQAVKAGATTAMTQDWSMELIRETDGMDHASLKSFWGAELAACKAYGLPDITEALQ